MKKMKQQNFLKGGNDLSKKMMGRGAKFASSTGAVKKGGGTLKMPKQIKFK